jgi:transcriptional regulator with XRE-family HTH domain
MQAARKNKGYSQADMANILGLTLEAYKKSEQRGALWADMIEPFAYAVGEDAIFMLTGRREKSGSSAPEKPVPIPAQPRKLRG